LAQRWTYPLSLFAKLDVSDHANFQTCRMITLPLGEPIVLRASQAKIGRGLPGAVATGASTAMDIHFLASEGTLSRNCLALARKSSERPKASEIGLNISFFGIIR
jgi:hypothetical protein